MAKKKVKKTNKQKCEICGDCDCGKDKKIKVFFCPKCKSKEVGYVFRFGNVFGLLPKMKCKKCGFDSVGGFPILVISESRLNKMSKSKK